MLVGAPDDELLYIKFSSTLLINLLFKSLSMNTKVNCIFTEEGDLFLFNDRIAQMNAYFTAVSAAEYRLKEPELRLTLNLHKFKQCLQLLNSDDPKKEIECEWIHMKESGQLQIKLRDGQVRVRSDLALYDYEESVCLDQEFLDTNIVAKAILPVLCF